MMRLILFLLSIISSGCMPYVNDDYSGYGSATSHHSAGTDVYVHEYNKKDGTHVRAHTRSSPGIKSYSFGGRSRSRKR